MSSEDGLENDVKSTETQPKIIKYAAIGSMCNPTSMKLRNINALSCVPGVLLDFRIQFMAPTGMASASYEKGCCFSHVVVWDVTEEDMKTLDSIESTYGRVPCKVRLYDDSVIDAFVYSQPPENFNPKEKKDIGIPSERYCDIIARGCIAANVDESYVNFIKNHEKVPRTKPQNFRSFDLPEGKLVKQSELEEHKNDEYPSDVVFCCNHKVIKIEFNPDGDARYTTRFNMYRKWQGFDNTFLFSQMLYEPMYPVAKDFDSMSLEHRAWVEDVLFDFFDKIPGWKYEVLGKLVVGE